MRLSGAAIGPDTVMVWTGARELTVFGRAGSQWSFTVPAAPLAWQIAADGVRIVDARGTIHRYSDAGTYEGAVALAEAPGTINQAALSADGRWLAILTDEIQLFEAGAWRPWAFVHRRPTGWREVGVDISANGRYVLARFETFSDLGLELGDNSEGLVISAQDGNVVYRHVMQQLPALEVALSPDGRWVARCEDDERIFVDETTSMRPVLQLEPHGRVTCFGFSDRLFGVLYHHGLAVVDVAADRQAWLDLPEHFEHLVLCERDVVVVHPELGAWWVPLASLAFTAAEG